MLLIYNFLILIVGFALYILYQFNIKKENNKIIFYLSKPFNLVDSLLEIIKNKTKDYFILSNFISQKTFNNLGLINGPVYLIKGKTLGDSHIKLYKRALEKIDYKINVILLDKYIEIKNSNVNLILKNYKELNLNEIALINSINVNSNINHFKVLESIQKLGTDNSIDERYLNLNKFNGETFSFYLKNGDAKVLNLPKTYFEYITKSKRNDTKIYNIFGHEILSILGFVNVAIINNKLKIKAVKNSEIYLKINLEKSEKIVLDLLNLKICCKKYQKNIDKLKENAVFSLNNDIFLLKNKIESIKTENLLTFFKVSSLRKNYFNDYIFLLKNIFGIIITNSIIVAKPMLILQDDFSIEYDWEGEVMKVEFKKLTDDEVKLNYVGHKMGQKDKYVFGF